MSDPISDKASPPFRRGPPIQLIATPDPIEAIRFRLDQAGPKTADPLPCLQSTSKISEIINRKRPLSLTMIRALHDGLKIPATVLVQELAAPTARTKPTNLRRKLPVELTPSPPSSVKNSHMTPALAPPTSEVTISRTMRRRQRLCARAKR